jgi:endonuclease/exonuclease/phosphatase (EEP) superfamily protein YafD
VLVALLVAIGALVARVRAAAAVALVAALALTACIVPRAIAGGPHPDGPELRVLTANILNGLSNKEQLTDIVRQERVDVLAIQEFTYRARLTLTEKGLDELLPHQVLAGRPGPDGTAIYSRFPLRPLPLLLGPTGHAQARAVLDVPGAGPVAVTAVHTDSPHLGRNRGWRASLRQLPAATPGRTELLVGDFNATLDHREMRRVLDRGWSDAADRTGDGLIGTWPSDASPFPTVALDHVLVSAGLGVRRTAVYGLQNSDHRVVMAVVELPAA